MDYKIPEKLITQLLLKPRVAVLTGAGISAESEVPTFRDSEKGLWADFNPEEVATPEAFHRNPKKVWEWYAWRRNLLPQVQPNLGHVALAELEKLLPDFTLITQNIDDLHRRAGSQHLIELHGNITRNKCFQENLQVEQWAETGEIPPRCPRCGGLLRPDVVWFGEILPEQALKKAFQESQNSQVFFSIGTSGVVEPAASLPLLALGSGATVVEINPEETPLTPHADFFLQGPSGKILPALLESLKKKG